MSQEQDWMDRCERAEYELDKANAEVEQLRQVRDILNEERVWAGEINKALMESQERLALKAHALRQRCDDTDIVFRTIEATLGVLDHSAAIDDESALAEHVSSKVARLVTAHRALRQRCEALEVDRARLDWLEQSCCTFNGRYCIELAGSTFPLAIYPGGNKPPDFRASLDAAISAQAHGGEAGKGPVK
jgi:hypothetical protein